MKLTPSAARRIRQVLQDVIELDGEQDEAPSLEAMARESRDLLSGPLREPMRPRGRKLAPGKTRDQRRAERRASAEQIRAAVFRRANNRCEVCSGRNATEWHHLVSGGVRRLQESEKTTMALCYVCHRALYRGDVPALNAAWEWARLRGLDPAAKALAHRIAKAAEARRVTG